MQISPISFSGMKMQKTYFEQCHTKQTAPKLSNKDIRYGEYRNLCQARDEMRDVQSMVVEFLSTKNKPKQAKLKKLIRKSVDDAISKLDKATLRYRMRISEEV